MITIRPSSYVYQLLELLSVAGEFPVRSLSVLGNERTVKALVHKLESVQDLRMGKDAPVHTMKMLQISGKGNNRTLRLYKRALPLLEELHPGALESYSQSFFNHRFPGDSTHIFRNHRIAEALAMMMKAGVEIRPYVLPGLQMTGRRKVVPDFPCFYTSREIKRFDTTQMNKTIFTRTVGALFYPGGLYAVYNTRDSVMRWSGLGEFKTYYHLQDLARMNSPITDFNSALLIGRDPGVALETMLESDKSRRKEMRFDRIYPHIHYIPLNDDGIRLLRILIRPNWQEDMLAALFPPELRIKQSYMELDAVDGDLHILSHLDSDIARLYRFHEAAVTTSRRFEVVCYPWQVPFLQKYLGRDIAVRVLEMNAVYNALGVM